MHHKTNKCLNIISIIVHLVTICLLLQTLHLEREEERED